MKQFPPMLQRHLPAGHRRAFLRGAGAGLVAAPAVTLVGPAAAQEVATPPLPDRAVARPMPQIEQEPPVPEAERVGWAVMGLGKFALNQIIPSFAECRRSKLVGLVSGSPGKARAVGSHYGVPESGIYGYGDFDRIRDNPDIDVVYVILPNGLHAEWAVRASGLGKHVMCEKPMATSVPDCERMIAAARDAQRKLMIAYRAQYEPYNLEAMRICRSGELGTVRMVTADHGRPLDPSDPADQWRMDKSLAGGGSLYDIGIYALQATRYLTGEEPVEVRAMIDNPEGDPRFAEVEDLVTFQLRFPSGALAHCSSSYSYADANRVHVQGTEAELRMAPATDYYERRMWLAREDSEQELLLDDANQFALEIDHLSRAVMENGEPKTGGEEGLRDVKIMEAIYRAAAEGRPVRLGA